MRARLRGLIGRRSLGAGAGMLFEPARQVHTFGMRFPIDVVFCDAELTVLRVVREMPPWRLSPWIRRARYGIEMAAGAARHIEEGDHLELLDQPSKAR